MVEALVLPTTSPAAMVDWHSASRIFWFLRAVAGCVGSLGTSKYLTKPLHPCSPKKEKPRSPSTTMYFGVPYGLFQKHL